MYGSRSQRGKQASALYCRCQHRGRAIAGALNFSSSRAEREKRDHRFRSEPPSRATPFGKTRKGGGNIPSCGEEAPKRLPKTILEKPATGTYVSHSGEHLHFARQIRRRLGLPHLSKPILERSSLGPGHFARYAAHEVRAKRSTPALAIPPISLAVRTRDEFQRNR